MVELNDEKVYLKMIPESNRVNILVIYLRIMKLMINGHITPPHLNEVMYTSEGCQSTDP